MHCAFHILFLLIKVREARGRVVVFLNQEDITQDLQSGNIVEDKVTVMQLEDSTIRSTFLQNDYTHAITVSLAADVNILNFVVNTDNIPNQGSIIGLLGNLNGDPSDDFVYPNGTVLPSDATNEMLHEWGQACKFIVGT